MGPLDGLELHPVEIPMRTRFRGVDRRAAIVMRGPAGWGEWSPFPEYPPAVAARWLAATLEACTTPWPDPLRDRVPVNVTVPAVPAPEAAALVVASGCTTAKVKVAEPGQSPDHDLARVAAVREVLGPAGRIRVDANGAWGVDEAERRLLELDEMRLEYAEQPCPTAEELAELRRRVGVPIAADESIRTSGDPERVVELEAADVLVLKVQPLGGVQPVLELAHRLGLPSVISSALETSVGMAAGVAAAAALPRLEMACGLGTVALLAGDVVAAPLVGVGGFIEVRRPDPDPALLDRWMPEPGRREAMLARLREAAAALEAAA